MLPTEKRRRLSCQHFGHFTLAEPRYSSGHIAWFSSSSWEARLLYGRKEHHQVLSIFFDVYTAVDVFVDSEKRCRVALYNRYVLKQSCSFVCVHSYKANKYALCRCAKFGNCLSNFECNENDHACNPRRLWHVLHAADVRKP